MRTGIGVSYTIAAILVIGGLLLVLVQSHGAADYYAPLYLGAVFSISGVAAGSFGSLRDSLLDEFVELVEDCSAPAKWFVIVGGAIGWVVLLLFLPLLGGLIIELARRIFLPTTNMTINDWLWLLSAITSGGIASLIFRPLRALFEMRPS